MLSVRCKFPGEEPEPSAFPNLFATESFLYSKSYRPRDTLRQLSVRSQMTKMNEPEASPRAPIGALAAGQDPRVYCRFCWAPPALQAQSSRAWATSGSRPKFWRNAGCRGCPQVTIPITYDPHYTIIFISTWAHNEHGECSETVAQYEEF